MRVELAKTPKSSAWVSVSLVLCTFTGAGDARKVILIYDYLQIKLAQALPPRQCRQAIPHSSFSITGHNIDLSAENRAATPIPPSPDKEDLPSNA